MNPLLAVAIQSLYHAQLSLAVPYRAPRFLRSVCESGQVFLSCVPSILQLWIVQLLPLRFNVCIFVSAARQYAYVILNTASPFFSSVAHTPLAAMCVRMLNAP